MRLTGLLACFLFLTTTLVGHFSPIRAQPSDYPSDPTADIKWSSGTAGVVDIQAAFNHARAPENALWGHYEDGLSPWERLDTNPAIHTCHDYLNVAENIAVFVTSGLNIPL